LADRVERSVAAGVWQRRQVPLGYRKDPATRSLVPDEHADRVRAAFQAKADGGRVADIARTLGLSDHGTAKLLRNRVYLGELRVGVHVNKTAHLPLVSRELFEAAQHAPRRRPARKADGPALLAGLARCAGCGHLMSRRAGRAHTYYCNIAGRCPQPASVTVALADDYVERVALPELERLRVSSTPGRELDQARRAVERAEAELAAFVKVDLAALGATLYEQQARKRRDAVGEAQAALADALATGPARALAGRGSEVWETLDAHERNLLLRGLLSAVVVRRAGGRGARGRLADRLRVLAYGHRQRFPVPRGNLPADVSPSMTSTVKVCSGSRRASSPASTCAACSRWPLTPRPPRGAAPTIDVRALPTPAARPADVLAQLRAARAVARQVPPGRGW
jgi:site-specific DNA recombinase